MSEDNQALADALDTPDDAPDASGPEDGTPAPESSDSTPSPSIDWQERYANLQPEYTRASQEAAQLRQLVEAARQGDPEALEILGVELAEDDDDLEDDEPDYRDPRVDQLLQAEAQRQAEAELDQLESHVESQIEQLAKSAGLELTDDEVDLVFGALTPGDDGNPDVERAFKKVTGLRDAHIESYRKSKKAPRVETGTAGTESLKTDTPADRAESLASLIEAAEQ